MVKEWNNIIVEGTTAYNSVTKGMGFGFHICQFRNIKHFCLNFVIIYLIKKFPQTVSFYRLAEL